MTSYLSPYSRAAVVAAALEYELECVAVLVFAEDDWLVEGIDLKFLFYSWAAVAVAAQE